MNLGMKAYKASISVGVQRSTFNIRASSFKKRGRCHDITVWILQYIQWIYAKSQNVIG
jgi:hypothetical protein